MAWLAYEHVARSGADPAVGLNDRIAALACAGAAIGLLISPVRRRVALMLALVLAYQLSSRWLAAAPLTELASLLLPTFAALYLCWPQLIVVKKSK
ncbi:MAG: hypothetical protein ACOYKQ_10395 [Polymorphobacter sp.]